MLDFFHGKGLILVNQSVFKPGHSCISQLLSITNNVCKSLDDGYEVRGVFLDISKAFFGPLLLLIYINNLADGLSSNTPDHNKQARKVIFQKTKKSLTSTLTFQQ